jgi:hypothetical protein
MNGFVSWIDSSFGVSNFSWAALTAAVVAAFVSLLTSRRSNAVSAGGALLKSVDDVLTDALRYADRLVQASGALSDIRRHTNASTSGLYDSEMRRIADSLEGEHGRIRYLLEARCGLRSPVVNAFEGLNKFQDIRLWNPNLDLRGEELIGDIRRQGAEVMLRRELLARLINLHLRRMASGHPSGVSPLRMWSPIELVSWWRSDPRPWRVRRLARLFV